MQGKGMKIGIIGALGVVGGAVTQGLARLGHTMRLHDKADKDSSIQSVLDAEAVFVCVPTPSRADGSCDTSIVEEVVAKLCSLKYNGVIAIKSTIEPGTTQRLRDKYIPDDGQDIPLGTPLDICFVPEFLRERSAFYDFTEGCDLLAVGTSNKYVFDLMKQIHGRYPKKHIMLNPTEAELLKYYSNCYNALRVTWANCFYDVCKKLDADYTKVKNAFVSRGTATDMYLDCNDSFRGFAGPCLPKETAALASLADKLKVPGRIFRTVVEDNKLYPSTVPDGMRS